MSGYQIMDSANAPIFAWTKGVPIESGAVTQAKNVASLPFIHHHVALMPDVHFGKGATVGSVIPTKGAIIPAAVGVDIGCGMMAIETTLVASDLPDTLGPLRSEIERKAPHGNGPGGDFKDAPAASATALKSSGLAERFDRIAEKHPGIRGDKIAKQIGTLGGGNHFIEICLDERERVWVMLHSGSRGTGNMIGTYFISRAREELARRVLGYHVPDRDLAFFLEGEPLFDDYVEAVDWGQDYARANREIMMARVLIALREHVRPFQTAKQAVNCHHNYVVKERHFDADVFVTRKGAVRAGEGELGIIPGSMGAKSFIVKGRGNADSFHTCSHGAGRKMSRSEAKRRFSLEDHARATEGVECRKDEGVIDETPGAYKDIHAVMEAQADLVEVVHTLRQVVCVKG